MYYAFCARENTVIEQIAFDDGIGVPGKIVRTIFNMLYMYGEPDDFVKLKSHSRENFLAFCQKIIGKVNCLETKYSGIIYHVGDNSWHQIFLQNRGDMTLPAGTQKPVLGTCSVRIRSNTIVMKIDECNTMMPVDYGRGQTYPHYYYRIYIPLIIVEKYWSQINHGIPLMKELRGLFKRKSKKEDNQLKYYLTSGSKEIINHIDSIYSIKKSLNNSPYMSKINIKKDGVYFWTSPTRNVEISQQLPDSLFSTFEKIVLLVDNLNSNRLNMSENL